MPTETNNYLLNWSAGMHNNRALWVISEQIIMRTSVTDDAHAYLAQLQAAQTRPDPKPAKEPNPPGKISQIILQAFQQ